MQTLTILRNAEVVEIARVVSIDPRSQRITIEGTTPAGGARVFDFQYRGTGYMDGFTARPYQVGDESRVKATNQKYERRYRESEPRHRAYHSSSSN